MLQFPSPKGGTSREGFNALPAKWVYAGRTFGRDRDYRYPDRDAAAGGTASQGGRAANKLRKQLAAAGYRGVELRIGTHPFSSGFRIASHFGRFGPQWHLC